MGDKKLSRSGAQKLLDTDENLQADVSVLALALAVERTERTKKTTTNTATKTTPPTTTTTSTEFTPEEQRIQAAMTSSEWKQAEAIAITQTAKTRNISRQAAWDIIKRNPELIEPIAHRLVSERLAATAVFGEKGGPPKTKEEAFAAGCTETEWEEAENVMHTRMPQRDPLAEESTTALLAWSAARRAINAKKNLDFNQARTLNPAASPADTTITIKTGERVNLQPYLGHTIAVQAKLGKNDHRTYTGTYIGVTEPVGDEPNTARFIILQDADGRTSHLNPSIIDTLRLTTS
jgi:hypothetical protein